ncbi:MAG: helix-turn-helix domain-containing protein [Desulfomonile sp.]|nr:helix-turn-helix domain-containing protein [Desulfomonile sp.]
MSESKLSTKRIDSGIDQLDRILGGLLIGDNVLWYDDTGSLVWPFCLNLMQASQTGNKTLIYVSFDRSPRSLLEKLGPLAENPSLTILDCFTWGKGEGSDVFLKFYYEARPDWPCRIIRVDDPKQITQVMDVIYGLISGSDEDVRLVFESITGMQELWGGEEQFLSFYAHSCPRLYELNTVAYWIVVKEAHSSKLRARINQIAQVAIELSIKRGTTFLNILKADRRGTENLHKPFKYWTKESAVTFEDESGASGKLEFGQRLKELRTRRGFSQGELAKLVGVTPSTISQVEGNLIYPSLPALVKMAEVLSVDVSSFFQKESPAQKIVFSSADSLSIKLPDIPGDVVTAHILTPVGFDAKAVLYLLEIKPGKKLARHFFGHKGEEVGYLLSGRLEMTVSGTIYKIKTGNAVHLSAQSPSQWVNPGPGVARLLWLSTG